MADTEKIRESLSQRKEYNLLDEKWITVVDKDSGIRKFSLKEVFERAQDTLSLANETEPMNASILRLLIAITQTVLWRYGVDGELDSVDDLSNGKKELMSRVEACIRSGTLPVDAIHSYLERHRDRFWLLHPEKPFYQSGDIMFGTVYENMAPFFGNVKESQNKKTRPRFRMNAGEMAETMSLDEAARWLIFTQSYASCVKNKKRNRNDCGVELGPLGPSGFIMYHGNDLVETIMFNLCALKDGNEMWSEPPVPSWEEPVRTTVHCMIPIPGNTPQYYTMQKRRIRLYPEGGRITGYCCADGDFYDRNIERRFEQMTLWGYREKDNRYVFLKHSPEKQAWREFPALFGIFDNTDNKNAPHLIPGVVLWFRELERRGLIDPKGMASLQTIGVEYSSSGGYLYKDIYTDVLDLSCGLFTEKGEVWGKLITEEVQKCERIAGYINICVLETCWLINGKFKQNDQGDNRKAKAEYISKKVRSRYFRELDLSFRKWILSIDQENSATEDKIREWRDINRRVAKKTVSRFINDTVPDRYMMRDGKSKYSIERDFSRTLNMVLKTGDVDSQ